jgi:hypothetical protein
MIGEATLIGQADSQPALIKVFGLQVSPKVEQKW